MIAGIILAVIGWCLAFFACLVGLLWAAWTGPEPESQPEREERRSQPRDLGDRRPWTQPVIVQNVPR